MKLKGVQNIKNARKAGKQLKVENGKWKMENYKTWESEDRMKTIKSKTNYAQRLSNGSEWMSKM